MLNVGETIALNVLLSWITRTAAPLPGAVPATRDEALKAAQRLTDAARNSGAAMLTREELAARWPEEGQAK